MGAVLDIPRFNSRDGCTQAAPPQARDNPETTETIIHMLPHDAVERRTMDTKVLMIGTLLLFGLMVAPSASAGIEDCPHEYEGFECTSPMSCVQGAVLSVVEFVNDNVSDCT